MNASYLSRLFKATTGETFSKHLLTIRLKEAAELLKNSGLRISEIGEYVGFRTISGNPRQFNYRDESVELCISAHGNNIIIP